MYITGRITQMLSTSLSRAGGMGFDYHVGEIENSQQLATAAMFCGGCVAQALNRGDGAHHSLHAWS